MDACVGQFAYFLAIVAIPPPSVELFVKLEDELGVDEVGEGISYVAAVVVVDGQVQEVYPLPMFLSDLFQQHFLGVLIWNMPDHDCGSAVSLNLSHL